MSEPSSWQTHFTAMWPRVSPSLLRISDDEKTTGLSAPPKYAGGGRGQAVKTSWNVLLHSLCSTAFVRHWGTPSVWYFNPMVLKMRILRSESTAHQLIPWLEKAELGMDPEPPKAYPVALALWNKKQEKMDRVRTQPLPGPAKCLRHFPLYRNPYQLHPLWAPI